MTLQFSSFPEHDSLLRSLDPRWKLTALVGALLLVPFLHTLPGALGALALAGALVLAARLPAAWYLSRLAASAAFLVLVVSLLPFISGTDDRAWSLGFVRFSPAGLYLASLVLIKAVAIVTLTLVLLASTPLVELFGASRALHVPGLLVYLILLTHRYVFLMAEELGRLRVALRVRGFRRRMSRHSYRTAGHVAGVLLVRGQERAERISQAMRCRGFDGRFRSLHAFSTRFRDVIFFLFVFGGMLALLSWDHIRP
jgi:cobalt/nickel transport system permease protein